MTDKRILLIIGGGIAAYKSLFLIRVLAKRGIASRVIITRGGAEFVTPLSAGALSGDKVYSDLWDLTDEAEMGHIELSRSAGPCCRRACHGRHHGQGGPWHRQ